MRVCHQVCRRFYQRKGRAHSIEEGDRRIQQPIDFDSFFQVETRILPSNMNLNSPDVRRPIAILSRTKSLQAQQYRAFLRAALPAMHDAPLEILRLIAAQVPRN
jgi:hypothetical protein